MNPRWKRNLSVATGHKKVVTIGGGTGSFTVLSGLKHYPLDLTAIVTMADDGGSTGTQLASVTFAGESASGWQVQNLSTPLAISANAMYTASVNTGSTYYVATNNGLASAITNGPVSTVVGSNGVLRGHSRPIRGSRATTSAM